MNPQVKLLSEWSAGRSAGISLLSALAAASVGPVREFLRDRREGLGVFVDEPTADDATWWGFYKSPKRLENAVLSCIVPGEVEQLRGVLSALRNPRHADQKTLSQSFSVILMFLADAGSDWWEQLADVILADQDTAPEDFDREPIAEESVAAMEFCLRVHLPCLFVCGVLPHTLMRQLSEADSVAETACQRLVRLDPRLVQHPRIRRWIHANSKLATFRRAKVKNWAGRSPFDKTKSESKFFRQVAGLISDVSELFDERAGTGDSFTSRVSRWRVSLRSAGILVESRGG